MLRNILSIMNKWKIFRDKDHFDLSIKEQETIIKSFKEPEDDILRSYYQYKCQTQLMSKYKKFFINIGSIPLFIMLYIKPTSNVIHSKKIEHSVIFIPDGKPVNILPLELRKDNIYCTDLNEEFYSKNDREFIKSILKRYPYSPFFLLKCLLKVKSYSYLINIYNTKSIIVCNEYSFTSSILTYYCELNGVEHINVMHGEKLYFIRDSFFKYTKCYIWDNFYRDLFLKLRAYDSFIVSIPESLKFKKNVTYSIMYDYTYYLADQDKEGLQSIYELMISLQKKCKKVAVRPHPRYSNLSEVQRIFTDIEVEDSNRISIESSIGRTKAVISLYSTVLNQAYYNNVMVYIDDITDKIKYEKLKELNYIMLNRNFNRLSSLFS